MMLFETQVKKSKPRSGADVLGLAALAKRAPIPGERERAAAIGALLFKAGGGVALRCANPNAVRPPAPDDRQASRIAVGKFISPPILRAIAKTGAVVPQGADTFTEPNPRPSPADIDFLHSPEVSPDLRAALVHAVKERTGAERLGTPYAMYQWDQSCTDLKDAIAELIERIGPAASALSRILTGGSGGGKAATARIAALQRSAMTQYSASLRKGAAVRKGRVQKFFDVTKSGEPESDFDWRSFGRTTLHGTFDAADRKTAELYRGSIARAPKMVNDKGFLSWGRRMLAKYGLSEPQARGVFGYISGSFA